MGKNRYPQVRENYDLYQKILQERKSIFTEVIEVNNIGNNANTLSKTENVKCLDCDEMILIVDVKQENYNFFQFKLRYKSFFPAPFFRFDSDGDSHRNKIDGIRLEEQIVTTPHFHKFNKDGIEIAYKTSKLLDHKEAKALEDINICIKHFFHESNLRLDKDGFSDIKVRSNCLDFKFTESDPNHNVLFS